MKSRQLISGLAGTIALACVAFPASAQNLQVTLKNVTFNDGATASGYFDYNPTTNVLSNFDINTTNGTSDNLLGSTYSSSGGTEGLAYIKDEAFYFYNNADSQMLFDAETDPITGIGTFQLVPGATNPNNPTEGLLNSGELAPTFNNEGQGYGPRLMSGELVASNILPVPEASTAVIFALVLSGGVLVLRSRRSSMAN